jgi:hypothetical protein
MITNAGVGPPIQPQQIVPDCVSAQVGKCRGNAVVRGSRASLQGSRTARRVDNPRLWKTQVGRQADENILPWINVWMIAVAARACAA